MVIAKGNVLKMGSSKVGRTYNFAFASSSDSVSLLIYDSNGSLRHKFEMDSEYKVGSVFACQISGEMLDKALYCYEVDGKKVIDPYAKTVSGCHEFGIEDEDVLYLSRIMLDKFDWQGDKPLNYPYDECIFYKMHVRGFTKSRTSGVKNKGTFAGIINKIPYLKELGITTIELMPAYEFDEMSRFMQFYEEKNQNIYTPVPIKMPVNYWGYTRGFHFAPKASFSSTALFKTDYTVEFKKMVKQLHANGIEVVMEMYFDKETPDMVLDCLRYWVTEYHIDGVHLYGSTVSLEMAAADPVLSGTKIITVYWNGNRGELKHMGNYNDGFSKVARCFLKGDENQLGDFVRVSRENPLSGANINYITNHNGFTMVDLVSYERKHNEANGENNKDGENFNHSWNCGVEGKSRKKKIVRLRQRQIKNAFMMLLLSAGTPLILAGDEFENSQSGNNNPYCIDGETTWLNWKNADSAKDMLEFLKELIAFRKKYKILHMPNQLMASDPVSCGYPDISYHGSKAWYQAMENYNRHIGIMYCTKYDGTKYGGAKSGNTSCRAECGDGGYELIYVAYNMHWEAHELALPKLTGVGVWTVKMCSGDKNEDVVLKDDKTVEIAPRTTAVLVSKLTNSEKKQKRGRK